MSLPLYNILLLVLVLASCSGSPMLSSSSDSRDRGPSKSTELNLLPQTIIQSCSSLAPEILQPLIDEAKMFVKAVAEMEEMENAALVMDMEMDMNNFSLSAMTLPIPGMTDMTVRSAVQMQIFNMYAAMKESIEKAKELGMAEDDLPVIGNMKDGEMKNEIHKMFKRFIKQLSDAERMVEAVQNSVKRENPYIEMAEKYTTIVGKMLSDEKAWDEAHHTVMCVYDVIADGEDLEMAEILKMFFPREDVENFSKRLHTSLHTIFKSPFLGELVRKMAQCVHDEFISMDVSDVFQKIEDITTKLKDRAIEIPFEEINFLAQDMVRKTWDMMMIGEAPELEKLVDMLVIMTAKDSFWEMLDIQVRNTTDMMNNTVMMMTMSMLSEGCDEASNPFLCCFKSRANTVLEMIEQWAEDLDSGNFEHCEKMMNSSMEGIKMMLHIGYEMKGLMLEKHGIGCMVDPYVESMMSEMKIMMPEMIAVMSSEVDYDNVEEDIIKTLNNVMDDGLMITQLAYGGCPEDAISESEPTTESKIWAILEMWVEAEPEPIAESKPEPESSS